jgi:kumamolisin
MFKRIKPCFKVFDETKSLLPRVNQSYYPTDLRRIYNFPLNYNGAGQTIAFIQLGGGFRQNDLDVYFNSLSINSPTIQFVSVNGGINNPTTVNSDDVEVMLDLCVAIGVANGIVPKVYMAPNSFKGFIDAVLKAVSDKVNVISISWGAPEIYWSTSNRNSMNLALKLAATNGITVCVASGDNGSSDGVKGLNVDFPGSSPYVVCCGGTKCVTSNNAIISEVVWNSAYGATGGGYSNFVTRPSYKSQLLIKSNKRGAPDVAANADPATGYKIITDGQNIVVGGTSAAAPLWAGIIACMNQGLGKNLGHVNSKLYSTLAFTKNNKPFRDTVSGNNGAYTAKTGWDACTGLGTPNVTNLLNYLKTR